jgi:hypothetical protein
MKYSILKITLSNKLFNEGEVKRELWENLTIGQANEIIATAFERAVNILPLDISDIGKGIFLIDAADLNGNFVEYWGLKINEK